MNVSLQEAAAAFGILGALATGATVWIRHWTKAQYVRRAELYHNDGELVYMRSDHCNDIRQNCIAARSGQITTTCQKIDDLKSTFTTGLSRLERNQSKAFTEISSLKTQVAVTAKEVEGIVNQDRSQELRDIVQEVVKSINDNFNH